MDETGWLIECTEGGVVSWFGYEYGDGVWTFDAGKAIRFSRKIDAQCMIDVLLTRKVIAGNLVVEAVEHMWCK